MYSTFPSGLRGAKPMSVMTALSGSSGSTSPKTSPTSFSYWPTLPKDLPSNVGDSTRVIEIRVTRASATAVGKMKAKPIATAHRTNRCLLLIVMAFLLSLASSNKLMDIAIDATELIAAALKRESAKLPTIVLLLYIGPPLFGQATPQLLLRAAMSRGISHRRGTHGRSTAGPLAERSQTMSCLTADSSRLCPPGRPGNAMDPSLDIPECRLAGAVLKL